MRGCLRVLALGLLCLVGTLAALAWLGSRLPDVEPDAPVQPFRPSFPTLVFATDDGSGAPEVDLSALTAKERRLARDLRALRVPTHDCRPPVDGPNTHAWFQQQGQDYANCLVDAWRPWLAEHGAREVTRVEVRHCSLAPWASSPECTSPEGVSWSAREGVFHLHDGFGPQRWGGARATHQLARIAAATLQGQVGVDEDEPLLLAGVHDEPAAQERREDLQVDCLAAAMVGAARDKESRRLAGVIRADGRDGTSAERFWLQQSARGIVGECDALVAAQDLVQG